VITGSNVRCKDGYSNSRQREIAGGEMKGMRKGTGLLCAAFCVVLPVSGMAQSSNASISGAVRDPSDSAIPNAQLTLRSATNEWAVTFTTNADGLYTFRNLSYGAYELSVSAKGFRDFVQRGIVVNINESVRLDLKLDLGTSMSTVEVNANASPLNFDNGELKQAITPENIQDLPLLVSGAVRSAASFVVLMPGVTTGGQGSPFDARINGGMTYAGEAVLDGVGVVQSYGGGLVGAVVDTPWSPESVGEISVLTSNFDPQYGASASGVVTAVTKSGTNEFHGSLYEFLRNTSLNARQYGVPSRPKDIENDFGGSIGGPLKIPWLAWTPRKKTYFFVNYEEFRQAGALSTQVLSIPSLKERQGDFTDWVDSSGKLIPVYDPTTTRANPLFNPGLPDSPTNLPFLRDQFMGCDGKSPNVICPTDSRLQNSLASQWFEFLPQPTFRGALNNYVAPPIPNFSTASGTRLIDVRVDEYAGDKDHVFVTVHYRKFPAFTTTILPRALANEATGYGYHSVDRLSWDHTFSPTILNHAALGYRNNPGGTRCLNRPYASDVPQISGVANHNSPPIISMTGFASFGCNSVEDASNGPSTIVNDQLTWVRGKHTIKVGGELRKISRNERDTFNESGSFAFTQLNTGLIGINSGSSIASFLLEQVASASVQFEPVEARYPRMDGWNFYAGDTWKISPKLSINYGLRWDVYRPSVEKYDHLSFFDPVGSNPGADNRPGRLAFAGTKWGAASFGRRSPEKTWYRGFAPRLGVAYSMSPLTVIRAGYGIFYEQVSYPGWDEGMALDGFNANISFSSSNSGLIPAFLLSQGIPQTFTRPPFINSAFANGQSLTYRPFDANRLAYTSQWNLTVEHQFTKDFYISAAYVGNKGTRLLSNNVPLNALDPKYLSRGQQLFDEFQPGQTSLDGVPVPYTGWIDQMTGCAPTIAQALTPYPQYCSGLYGLNENAGSSIYHSLQIKAEKRFARGFWFLTSYTLSKLVTSAGDDLQTGVLQGSTLGVISPFERHRNKSLAMDDVPQVLSVSLIYQLPIGLGKRLINKGGLLDKVLGGWSVSNIFRASSGIPFYFRSSVCNVPSQFRAACIPAILPGADPWAQDKSRFDSNKPLFNNVAFEDPSTFNFYYGKGPRISNLRGFGYHNHDVSLLKDTRISEKVKVQFRAEFFNVWNWHNFGTSGQLGSVAFNNDVSSPAFGIWNGSVSNPRNIQLGIKLLF
jgi:hypothetical protein